MINTAHRTGLTSSLRTPAAQQAAPQKAATLCHRPAQVSAAHSLPERPRPLQELKHSVPCYQLHGRQLLTFGPRPATALSDARTQPAVPAAAPQQRLSYGPSSRPTKRVVAAPVSPAPVATPRSAASRLPLVRIALPVARSAAAPAAVSSDDVVRVANVGDLVTIHYTCRDKDGKLLETSKEDEDGPVTFEVGAGDIVGNVLFQGFDEAVRGLAVGQTTVLEAEGGEWKPALLFAVPEAHPEITRLQGRYKNQGGLKEGMIVELANGGLAVIVSLADGVVKIDANNMLAGKQLIFELEVVKIEKAPEAQ